MPRLTMLCAAAVALGAVAITGCAKPEDLERLRSDLTAQLAQNSQLHQQQIQTLQSQIAQLQSENKALAQRVAEATKIPAELEAQVAAAMRYARDVEKSVHSLRELMARELDRQNTHITKVKSSYKSVLEQELQAVAAMSKALDAVMTDLKGTIENSAKVLGEALPDSGEAIPPAPTLPKDLKIEGGGLELPGVEPKKAP